MQRNLQILATEKLKARSICLEFVNLLFEFTNKSYDLRKLSILKRKRNFKVYFGSESLSFLAPEI